MTNLGPRDPDSFTHYVFQLCLKMIRLSNHRNIYVLCEFNDSGADALVTDLSIMGIPKDFLFYQKWTAPPGSGIDNLQFHDAAIAATEVALLFDMTLSSYLRISLQNKVVIPVYFNNHPAKMPGQYQVFPGFNFTDEYYNNFFRLITSLYKLNPINNEVYEIQRRFHRLLESEKLKDRFEKEQARLQQQDELEIFAMLGV